MKDILYTAVLSLCSIAVLFALGKLAGKRQIAQMTLFDYVNSITIGSIAAEMATDLENWHKSLTALIVYGLVTAAIAAAGCKSIAVRRFINGKPAVLFRDGVIRREELRRAKLDLNSFLSQCRQGGYFDLGQLKAVLQEPSGQLSFLSKTENRPATPGDLKLSPPPETLWTPLVLDGKLMEENLKSTGRSRDWLMQKLHGEDIGQISEVLYAAADQSGNFFACRGE